MVAPMNDSSTSSVSSKEERATLYERLGGDAMMNIMVWSFFDELVEHPDMKPFFKNIAMVAMKTHTVKLFKVMFGTDEEQPDDENLREYLLRTHTRLFRDLGLDAGHFDTLAGCFVEGLQSFQVSQDLIDECVALMAPLRVVFEYGAELAKKEKEMDPEELKKLPWASAKTIGTEEPAVLPTLASIDIPDWLPTALAGKKATKHTVREWTCELTDRFGAEGDSEIADTFLDQPWVDHHIFCVSFLQLAFLPDDIGVAHRQNILEIVMYPRGRDCARLSRHLFDRMITQFALACQKLGMLTHHSKPAEEKLLTYRSAFAGKTVKVGGATCPHILSKTYEQHMEMVMAQERESSMRKSSKKKKRSNKKAFTRLIMEAPECSETETG
ncbi:whole genome shotgun sequence (Partial), partial [Seminavis robusta]